jgi:hypothetical protein
MIVVSGGPTRIPKRSQPAPRAPRGPLSPALRTGHVSAGASLLAATFSAPESETADAAREPEPASVAEAPVRLSAGAGTRPGPSGARDMQWLSGRGAARGALLDLQRLAGNAAVSAALHHHRTPGATVREEAPSASWPPIQRIEIPGLGNIDIGGYVSRALSVLGPAERGRDQARSDARKQADDTAHASDTDVADGDRDLEAGKRDAERARDTGFDGTRTAHDAATSAEQERNAAGRAHGDQVADDIRRMIPSIEGMVDPLAGEAGEPEEASGHEALGEAADHAANPAATGGEGPVPASADQPFAGSEPAVSHGPGPPAPAPAPEPPTPEPPTPELAGPEPGSTPGQHGAGEPVPEIEHGPAQAGPGEGHEVRSPEGGPQGPAAVAPDTALPGPQQAPVAGAAPQPVPELPPGPAPRPGPAPSPGPAPAPGELPGAPQPPGRAPPASGRGPTGATPAGTTPSGGTAGAQPTCGLVEAVKTVEGWREKARSLATRALTTIGSIPIFDTTVGDLVAKARRLAGAVTSGARSIRDAAVGAAHKLAGKVKRGISTWVTNARRSLDGTVKSVKEGISRKRERLSAQWDAARERAAKRMQSTREWAARTVGSAVAGLRNLVESWSPTILNLLGPVAPRIRALLGRDPLGDAASYLQSRLDAIRSALRSAKERASRVVHNVIDFAKNEAVRQYQLIRRGAQVVVDVAKTVAPYVAGVVAPGAVVAAAGAKAAARRWGSDLRAGAAKVGSVIRGTACEAIGDVVGPCIDMYLPKPDNKDTSFATLTGQADVTVPLQELDIPCNVKVGRGATISVVRSADAYAVSVDGQALVYANAATTTKGTKAEVKTELPTGGMATVWEHLGGAPAAGGSGAPATGTPTTGTPVTPPAGTVGAGSTTGAAAAPGTPTTGGGTPGTPGATPGTPGSPGAPGATPAASGPSASFEAEAGLKGTASLKFSFPTTSGTTCQGGAGVASLLGALGVAASLPAPLDALARAGVVGSWEDNLVSNTVTLAVAGSGQVGLSEEGLGSLTGQGQAEVYATAGVERPNLSAPATGVGAGATGGTAPGGAGPDDRNVPAASGPYAMHAAGSDPNALRPVLRLGTTMKGELTGQLVPPKMMVIKGGGYASGKLEAMLLYDRPRDRIMLQSVTSTAEVGVSAGGLNPAAMAATMGTPYGPAAAAAITRLGLAHNNGAIKATVTNTANNLQKYLDAVDGYLMGPPATISAAGLVSSVRSVYNAADFTSTVVVTATVSDRAGIEATYAETGDEGEKLGASEKVTGEIGKTYQLYP